MTAADRVALKLHETEPAKNLSLFISHDANSVVAVCSSQCSLTSQDRLECRLTVTSLDVVQGTRGTVAATA